MPSVTHPLLPDLSRHNRKDKQPSQSMLPSDGGSYRCPWIEDSITILSDGTATCGLDDSDGLRCFGNIKHQSLSEIFANPEYARLREGLEQGKRCRDCSLFQDKSGPHPERGALPKRLVVEPTIRCNLRCPQAACFANNSAAHLTRDEPDLSRDVLDQALSEVGGQLEEVYFFNYGDPFMHREAPKMVADIRRHSPGVKIVTSTNGIPLASAKKAQELVAAGLDHIVFTISGMTQESYSAYHVNGRLDTALRGLRHVAEARREAGIEHPKISWRYLLFRWTDQPEEIDAAIELAEELGVDDFNLYLTHIPEDGWSYRMAEGTPGFARYRKWVNVAFGYNRPDAPRHGVYPPEELPLFGPARWTTWRPTLPAWEENGEARLWLSTNAPSAFDGGVDVYIRTPWRRVFKARVPYCRWGEIKIPVPFPKGDGSQHRVEVICPDAWFPKDELGVDDYRCLGVLTTAKPRGSLPKETVKVSSASPVAHKSALMTRNGGSLIPVPSALFKAFDG